MTTKDKPKAHSGTGETVVKRNDAVQFLMWFNEKLNIKRILMVYTGLVVLYIYLPMISLFVFSFNSGGLSFPFTGFTMDWYGKLFANTEMKNAVWTSLKLAGATTIVTTTLSTAVALAFRKDFRGKRQVLYYVMLGLLVPGITYGFGALLFLNNILQLPTGFWLAVTVEVVWTLPFGVIILLAGFPPNLEANEQAARVMGADRYMTFRKVIFPLSMPGVVAGSLLVFIPSTGAYVIPGLLGGTDSQMIGNFIANQFGAAGNWPLGAAGSFTLMGIMLFAIALYQRYGSADVA